MVKISWACVLKTIILMGLIILSNNPEIIYNLPWDLPEYKKGDCFFIILLN